MGKAQKNKKVWNLANFCENSNKKHKISTKKNKINYIFVYK